MSGHLAEAISHWLLSDADHFVSKLQAIPEPSHETVKPHWDADDATLLYNNQVVKRFKQAAKNQRRILAEFEELGWPRRIDNPLPWKPGEEPKQCSDKVRQQKDAKRFSDAVDELNGNHEPPGDLLHFERDGTGQGVRWHAGPKRISTAD